MKMSRLLLQLRLAVTEEGAVNTKDAVLETVLAAKIAEATGWVSMPDLH